ALAFSPDGRTLAAGSFDGLVRLWRVDGPGTTSTALPALDSGDDGPVQSLTFSPDGRTLVAGTGTGTVRLWSISATGADLRTVVTGPGSAVFSVAFSPDGRSLVAGSQDTT